MDCLRSFSLITDSSGNFGSPQYKTWGPLTDLNWDLKVTGSSIYNVEGFKNINIYGFDVVGNFQSYSTANRNAIVNDWGVTLQITGQAPLTNGNIDPAYTLFQIRQGSPTANGFQLSRYKTGIKLASPIQSVTKIEFVEYYASGVGAESASFLELFYDLNFVFYYNFEGE